MQSMCRKLYEGQLGHKVGTRKQFDRFVWSSSSMLYDKGSTIIITNSNSNKIRLNTKLQL